MNTASDTNAIDDTNNCNQNQRNLNTQKKTDNNEPGEKTKLTVFIPQTAHLIAVEKKKKK